MIGAGDKETANRAFSLSLVLSLALSFLMAFVCIVFSDGIAMTLGARGALAQRRSFRHFHGCGIDPLFRLIDAV